MTPRDSCGRRLGRVVMRLVPLTLLLTTGCAEVGFKRGAMPGDLSADQASCRAATADAGAYRACLRERGWHVAAPAPAAPPTTGNASPVSSRPAGADPDSEALGPAAPSTPTSTPASVDMTDGVAVRSWWKRGATSADLDADINTCVAALGAVHRPAPGADRVTVGLKTCLRELGWYGLGG